MSNVGNVSNEGRWVWNVLRADADVPFQLSAGQLETDSNGLHLCHGPGHCGGLIASFPLGTLVWREELRPALVQSAALPVAELVVGEVAAFDLPARVEIGAINITCQSADAVAGIAEAIAKVMQARKDLAVL